MRLLLHFGGMVEGYPFVDHCHHANTVFYSVICWEHRALQLTGTAACNTDHTAGREDPREVGVLRGLYLQVQAYPSG